MVSFSLLNNIDPTTIIFIVLLALLVIALLVVPMFTNKKRARQTDELHRSLKPGDLIKTVGGVVGTIVEIRQISPVDKEMVIETGLEGSKTTMVFDIQALYQVMSRSSTIVPAGEEPQAEDETANADEQSTPENEQPQRVVPDILADRTAQAEAAETPVQDAVAEKAEEPTAEPKEEAEMAAENPAQKNGPVKKSNVGKKTNK